MNNAIAEQDGLKIDFNVSEFSSWSSIKSKIANRENLGINTVEVETITLNSIFDKYGVPYYCKIDIEGFDEVCLESLKNYHEYPTFISIESECEGEGQVLTEEESLSTLTKLKALGYTKFKLVDQTYLEVLKPNEDYFDHAKILIFENPNIIHRVVKKIYRTLGIDSFHFSYREKLSKKLNFDFSVGASGPFGEDLEGEWLNFEEAKRCLLKHRNDYFNLKAATAYGFWCDWHATN